MSLVTAHPASSAFPSDERLLERYSRGDRTVLDELFRRHRDMAYRVAYRLLGKEEDALDAVQEAFVKVLAHISGFQGRSSFKTWLLRVVSNAALDLGRQRGRRDVLHREELPADAERDPPAAVAEPSFELERADLRRILNEALAQLPEPQRKTFVLHVEGGLSYREVAEVMEISIGTVMSRLFYTRQKLRTILADRVQI
jgi:RNA polymerase sigma-70 factor (ECF subfamily)